MTIMRPNAMPCYGGFTCSTKAMKIVNTTTFLLYKKTHYGLVISGPRINGDPFSKDAKGMDIPSGDNAAFGQ